MIKPMSKREDSSARLRAKAVGVSQGHRVLLPATTFAVEAGELAVVAGDPGPGHALLALALAGRLDHFTGSVALDGSPDRAALQKAVALVDVPTVSEPDDAIPLHTIVGEELAMARRPAGRRHVAHWLEEQHFGEYADARIEDLPAVVRTTVLARLAEQRPGVRHLVIALPERNGGLPADWWQLAHHATERGYGVVVTVSLGSAEHLDDSPVLLGNATMEHSR